MFGLLAPAAGIFGGSGGFGDDMAGILDPGGFFHQKQGKETQGLTTTQPWAPQGQLMQDIWGVGRGLWQDPIEYYPGQTIAGFTPEQLDAQNQIIARATQGSPLLRGAQQEVGNIGQGAYLDRDPNFSYMQDTMSGNFDLMQDPMSGQFRHLEDTLSGKYISPETNPYLPNYVQEAFEETLPQLDTSAIQAGRYGSGAWGQMKGRTMADITSDIYGKAYERERGRQAAAEQYATGLQTGAQQYAQGLQTGAQQYATGLDEQAYQSESARQMQALGMAPEMAREDYYDMAQKLAVGEEKQAMQQAQIDEAIKKFEFQQMEPWERIGMLANLATGDFGGTTAATASQRGK